MVSADDVYRQAQARWKECLDLSVHDDAQSIAPVVALLERAVKADPDHVPALRLAGYLHMQAGDDREAKQCVRRLLDLFPGDETAREQLALLDGGTRDERLDWLFARWQGDWSGPFPVEAGSLRTQLPAFPLTDAHQLQTWLAAMPALAQALLPHLFPGGERNFRPTLLEPLEKELPPSKEFYETLNDVRRITLAWLAGEIFRRSHQGKWVVQVEYPKYTECGLPQVVFPDNCKYCFFLILGRYAPGGGANGTLPQFFQWRQTKMDEFNERAAHPVPFDAKQLDAVRIKTRTQFKEWLTNAPKLVKRGIRALAPPYRDRLDYSVESLAALEELLLLAPPFGSALLLAKESLERTTWTAAYLGEVLRRRFPALGWVASFAKGDANCGIPTLAPRPDTAGTVVPLLLILEFADRRKPGFLREAVARVERTLPSPEN